MPQSEDYKLCEYTGAIQTPRDRRLSEKDPDDPCMACEANVQLEDGREVKVVR